MLDEEELLALTTLAWVLGRNQTTSVEPGRQVTGSDHPVHMSFPQLISVTVRGSRMNQRT